MASKLVGFAILASLALWLPARGDEVPKAPSKADYAEFSKLVQKMVVKQVPKYIEDNSGWGGTVPVEEKLPLSKLRTVVKVGDRLEMPHGLWRKVRVWVDDPDNDLKIQVRDFKAVDAKTYKLTVEADALLRTESEWKQWQKGLALLNGVVRADAAVNLVIDCDVAVTLKAITFPPEFAIAPKVADLKLDLRDFTLKDVTLKRLGLTLVEGDQARDLGNQFKDVLQGVLKAAEPTIKEQANQAILRSLQDGKGTLSAAEILKAVGSGIKAKE